eukprot:3753753-Pleurochrysis_carterae.AAC.1
MAPPGPSRQPTASAASSSTMTPMEAQAASPDSQPSPLPPRPKVRDRMPNVPIINPNKRKAIAARTGAQKVFRNC